MNHLEENPVTNRERECGDLDSHLEWAVSEVRTWPEWKQKILGPALPEHRPVSVTQDDKQYSY